MFKPTREDLIPIVRYAIIANETMIRNAILGTTEESLAYSKKLAEYITDELMKVLYL